MLADIKEEKMEEFYIGQIFENNYPPEAAQWCNAQENLKINEIEPLNNVRRFVISEIPALTPEEERERVGNLKCTKREFALVLRDLGISYAQLKSAIAEDELAQLEWDLCTELVRKNPMLDKMAPKFNVSKEQIDNIFKFINGEIESI